MNNLSELGVENLAKNEKKSISGGISFWEVFSAVTNPWGYVAAKILESEVEGIKDGYEDAR